MASDKPDEARCPACGSKRRGNRNQVPLRGANDTIVYGEKPTSACWDSWHDNAVEMAGGGAARQRPNAPEPEPAKSAVRQPVSTDAALREAVEKAMREQAGQIAHYIEEGPGYRNEWICLQEAMDESLAANERAEAAERRVADLERAQEIRVKALRDALNVCDEARKALAEYRERWGHGAHCACHDDADAEMVECAQASRDYGSSGPLDHEHPFCDPRCAPPEGRKP